MFLAAFLHIVYVHWQIKQDLFGAISEEDFLFKCSNKYHKDKSEYRVIITM